MPSTTNAPTPAHQAAMIPKHPRSEDRVSQTVYDDGRGRCIVASRKRPASIRRTNATENEQSHSRSLRQNDTVKSEERLPVRKFLRSPASPTMARGEGLASSREVCVEQSPKYPREVIVLSASSRPTAIRPKVERSSLQRPLEPTPPPTPCLGRLPSPELSDLEEALFCECDEAIIPRYCMSCKKAMHPWGK